jgi:alkylation response protein AidB-like acyl-CoA dehydrogenase
VVQDVLEEVRSLTAATLDREPTWGAFAEAGLLALAAPESLGGDGLGLAEVAVVLQEAGRRASTLPFAQTLAGGLLPLVAAGPAARQAELVPPVLSLIHNRSWRRRVMCISRWAPDH